MKKIFFIAFIVVGSSSVSIAQEGKAEGMSHPPSQAEADKGNRSKMQENSKMTAEQNAKVSNIENGANQVKMQEMNKTKAAENTNMSYKKAGLTPTQISELNKSMMLHNKKIAENNNNSSLSAEERTKANQNLEAEKNNLLRKTMGTEGYKTYMQSQKQEMLVEQTKN